MNRWRIDEHPLVQVQRALNLQTNGVLMECYHTANTLIPAALQSFHVIFVYKFLSTYNCESENDCGRTTQVRYICF